MDKTKRSYTPLLTLLGCLVLVAVGVMGFMALGAFSKPPAAAPAPKALSVTTLKAEPQRLTMTATGYGQALPVTTTPLSAQVAGKITRIHPALEEGGRVARGELLFEIDPTDYRAAVATAQSQVALKSAAVTRLEVSRTRDQDRLPVARQTSRLARNEFSRLKTLFEKESVGTLSAVETAESAYNAALDAEKTLIKSLEIYPLQIAEARADLAQAQTALDQARTDLGRCRVTAPFAGRIKSTDLEVGTYVAAGTVGVTLADDQQLEIQVSLSDTQAFATLGIKNPAADINSLVTRVSPVSPAAGTQALGRIDRVVKYDADTRTLCLAVRVTPDRTPDQVALMDGMFCQVTFEGPTVENTLAVPPKAVNPDDTVYLAREGKIKILNITRILEGADRIYISGDFLPGDEVITSAPAQVLEDMPVQLADQATTQGDRS